MTKFPFKNVFFLMQKPFSASNSTTPVGVGVAASPSSSFTVEYLVSSCGVPLKSAIAIEASQKFLLQEEKIQRYDSVLNLLTSHGFDQTHIAAMTGKVPSLLSDYKVDENLRPKLEYLALNGFSGSHLHHLIVSNPNILRRSLNSAIKPSLEFLRSFLGTEERIRIAAKRHSRLLINDLKTTLQPNIDLLVMEGVPLEAITKFFVGQPNYLQCRVDRLVYAIQTVKDRLGMDPSSPQFLVAVGRIASSGGLLLEKKIEVFKSFGFSEEDVLRIFRRYPCCISRSEETLRTKLEFYLHTVKLKLDDVISYPNMLSLATETRSRPRHNVLKLLLSKKLLKEDTRLAPIFTIGEDKFITEYLQQVPSLMEMYVNDKIKRKIDV